MVIGIVIGVLCAVARGSPNPVLRTAALFYAWFFRGTPVILQLLIWFNLALVFPHIAIPGLFDVRTVDVITPAVATLLGLGLNEGAYVSEIVRAGLLSVDRGQYEASKSIGMSYWLSLRRIILPQAMRVVVPPLGNEFIALLKITSLASIIGFSDILRNAQDIYYTNAKVIELLMVAPSGISSWSRCCRCSRRCSRTASAGASRRARRDEAARFGGARREVLRIGEGARGRHSRCDAERGGLRHRPIGFRQDHAS